MSDSRKQREQREQPESPRKRRHQRQPDGPETLTHSPTYVNPGLPPPHDGECAASLTYDAMLHLWIYVAAYDTAEECRRLRAASLQRALGLPFLTIEIGDRVTRRSGPGLGNHHSRSPQRYIPGWYAASYADPRGQALKPASAGLAPPEPEETCQHTGCWRHAEGACGACGKPICGYHAWFGDDDDLCATCAGVKGR